MRSTLVRIESRGDGALFPWRSVDEERCSEDVFSQSRLRSVSLSEGFLGCRNMRKGDKDDSSQAKARRGTFEALLQGDSSGSRELNDMRPWIQA